MAVTTNATLLVRRGLEADFNPSKMKQGEWALSTDNRYIRMCVANGVCIRMATYEAFEEDMAIIEQIVEEARGIQETLEEISRVVSGKADQVEVWAEDAEINATLAQSWAVGGTGSREGEDTNNAKYWAEHARAIAQLEWEGVNNKPFESIGANLSVDEDGHLNAEAGGTEILTMTLAEYEAMKDQIPPGTQFIITDDYEDSHAYEQLDEKIDDVRQDLTHKIDDTKTELSHHIIYTSDNAWTTNQSATIIPSFDTYPNEALFLIEANRYAEAGSIVISAHNIRAGNYNNGFLIQQGTSGYWAFGINGNAVLTFKSRTANGDPFIRVTKI